MSGEKSTQKIILLWFCIAIILTAVFGLIGLCVQQNYRQSANDPQIQMAEDFASKVGQGKTIQSLFNSGEVDISKSLSTFIIFYDSGGMPVAGNALLNSNTPVLPSGVLEYAKNHNENRITWQPQKDTRIALVVKKYEINGETGFVAVGRSLREIEKREDDLTRNILLGWLFSLIIMSIGFTIWHNMDKLNVK